MVYGIFGGEYSDWEVYGYFKTREEAEKYCVYKNKYGDRRDELYIMELDEIKAEIKQDIEVLYEHHVVFDFNRGMRDYPDDYTIYCGDKRETKLTSKYNWFSVMTTAKTRKVAEKIAQDYYGKFLALVGEVGLEEARKLMCK